jgi:hypothetical protein
VEHPLAVAGWRFVLFLDRGSPHTARASRRLARGLGIELRLLPTACPEQNPLREVEVRQGPGAGRRQ